MENHQPKTQHIPLLQHVIGQLNPSYQCQLNGTSLMMDCSQNSASSPQIDCYAGIKNPQIRRETQNVDPQFDLEYARHAQKNTNYSRKDKSLMELTRKFIQKFEGTSSSNLLILDQVTGQLNVQRRRIYDIINIMESLSVVSKVRKNVYHWKGLKKAVQTIESFNCKYWPQIPQKNRKQKSLQSLATQFLKLFSQRTQPLTLQESAQIILSDVNDHVKKTKIRRLYDIVNVFKCLGLVQKVKNSREVGGKPLYQWLGCKYLQQIIEQKQNLTVFSSDPDEVANEQQQIAQKQTSDCIYSKNASKSEIQKEKQSLNFRDISNNLQIHQSSTIIERKKKLKQPILKKSKSFTFVQKNCDIKAKQRNQKNKCLIESQNFDQNSCPSYFWSILMKLDTTGTSSLADLSQKMSMCIWPLSETK